MILPRDVSRCPGIHQPTGSVCPQRERCRRYLAGVEDAERNDACTSWTNYHDPSDLMGCTDQFSQVMPEGEEG